MLQSKTITAITGYGVLALIAGVSFWIPRTLSIPSVTAAPPDEIRLVGTVRDFHAAHPDFDVVPDAGYGHYAGSLMTTLDSYGRPVRADGGPGEAWRDDGSDLVAYWKLDDGGGGVAADFLGANPGALFNGPTWVAGQDGGALHFDGIDDYVEIPSSPETQINGDVTCTGWFKLDEDFDDTSPDTLVIMEKFLDTEHDFHIALAGGDYNRPEVGKGSLVFKIENGPTSDYYRYKWTNRTSWTAGVWYHFAATVVSADTSQNVLFIDGVDDTSPIDAGGVGFIDTDYDAPLRIGGKTVDYNGLATDIFFKGTLDDIKFFRRALETEDFTPPTGGGFKVAAQWTEAGGRNIAPHLFAGPGGDSVVGALIGGNLRMSENTLIDSWNSSLGSYAATRGSDAVVVTNTVLPDDVYLEISSRIEGDLLIGSGGDPGTVVSVDVTSDIVGTTDAQTSSTPMPTVEFPTDMGASTGDFIRSGAGTTTINADLHCDQFLIDMGHVVTISGDVRILCEDKFDIGDNSRIDLAPGSSLAVYAKMEWMLHHSAAVNLDGDPRQVTIYHAGGAQIQIHNDATLYGHIVAPSSVFRIMQSAEVFGRVTAESLRLSQLAQLHLDSGDPMTSDACGTPLADIAGSKGAASNGGISSADTFDEWYRDVLGTNQSSAHTITLTRDGGGVYQYLTNAFYPIDARGFGNDGDAHNYYFTYHVRARFQYTQCVADFIEFEGGDGVWIFIDGKLAIDLGGVGAIDDQYVELDRLRLTDGETYSVDLFFAQRQAADVPFRLRTTLELSTTNDRRTVSAMFD